MTGEDTDNDIIATRGDSRISITMAKDEYSADINRETRFLIDDYDSDNVLAYRASKPFKLGGTYYGKGVYTFVLAECTTEDTDNFDLHIANYYKYFPREAHKDDEDRTGIDDTDLPIDDQETVTETPDGRTVWF